MSAALVECMRPRQWAKNLVMGLSLFDAGKLLDGPCLVKLAVGFFLFTMLSSAAYIVNDLADIEKDRLHPENRNRPLPSGRLPIPVAVASAMLLAVLGLTGAFLLSIAFGVVASAFLALMITYSFFTRNIIFLDVVTISGDFTLRVMAGTVAIDAPWAPWLLVCTMFVALSLALMRRRYELARLSAEMKAYRPVLLEYDLELLDHLLWIGVSAAVVCYSVYSIVNRFTSFLVLTVPFMIYGIFRYTYLMRQDRVGGRHERIYLGDVPFMLNAALWLASAATIIVATRP